MNVLEIEASTAEMAEVLGIHVRSLQKLAKDVWIDGKVGHDKWNLAKTVQSYTRHVFHERLSGA